MSDFQDFASRFKKAQADEPEISQDSEAPVIDAGQSLRLRAKMFGVLMRDARIAARRSIDDVSRHLRLSPHTVEAWELGEEVASLPQVELLAFFLDVPVSHFWSIKTIESVRRTSPQEEFLEIRNRVVGLMMRQAREEIGMSLADLATYTDLEADLLEAYEMGQPIPFNELAVIASGIQRSMTYFLETSSQIGDILSSREKWKHFNNLPHELREFAANPQNIGFIEIALAFSRMSADTLKSIAVSMLDISGY